MGWQDEPVRAGGGDGLAGFHLNDAGGEAVGLQDAEEQVLAVVTMNSSASTVSQIGTGKKWSRVQPKR